MFGVRCSAFDVFFISVGHRQRYDSAVEKIIDLAVGRIVVARHRDGVGAVNKFIAQARDKKAGAGSENDVVREQRSPFKADAAIDSEIVTDVVIEQDQFSRRGVDGANVIRVYERAQLRQDVGIEPVTDNE